MLIAISTDGRNLSDTVSHSFEACRYLLLVETESLFSEVFENTGAPALAELVVSRDCEAVITGSFTPEIFSVIADACITRYKGGGLTVTEALGRMNENSLDYIRYADENDTCHGDHSGGACNCGEDG